MLQLTTLYNGADAASDTLELDFAARSKSRQRVRLASGSEAALLLPRGSVLRGGQCVRGDDGRIVCVLSAPESLLEARCADAHALARAAYHLGNRHVAVEIGAGWLRIQADHVLEQMLRGLGVEVHALHAPFEPEAGAYAHGGHAHSHSHDEHDHAHEHGHGHSHGEGSGAKIHMMGA